jgi:hypothetical protein
VVTLAIIRGVSKSFRTESITKYMLTTINTHPEATQRVMAAKLTRLTHKIATQLHLVAEICTICRSRSRWPVRKLLNTPSYTCRILIFVKGLKSSFRLISLNKVALKMNCKEPKQKRRDRTYSTYVISSFVRMDTTDFAQ